jgi:hypothetical protein
MTAANILLYVALIGFMIYRRIQGRPVESVKKLLVLPVIIGILGWQDIEHAHHLNDIDITVSVIGCGLSLVLGAARGVTDKISERDGLPWVQWSVTSIVVFAVNIVVKLGLDAGGVALGGTSKGVTSSLLLAVGLMLIGEALVILYRVQGAPPGPSAQANGGGARGAGREDHQGPATPRQGEGGLLSGGSGLLGGGSGLLGGRGGLFGEGQDRLLGGRRPDDESDRRRQDRDRRHGHR